MNKKLIIEQIARFFVETYGLSANEKIENCKITSIDVTSNNVIIKCRRPGVFIGKRGEQIHNLEEFLSKKIILIEDGQKYDEDLLYNNVCCMLEELNMNSGDYFIPIIP